MPGAQTPGIMPVFLESPETVFYAAPVGTHCLHGGQGLTLTPPLVRLAGFSRDPSLSPACSLCCLAWACLRTLEEGSPSSVLRLFTAPGDVLHCDCFGPI